jgi:lipoprotein-anchoring transpeptidase ErfK/SrfK
MPSWRAIASGVVGLLLIGVAGCATTAPASREADPAFARQTVAYATHEAPGTIVIDPASHFLYLVQGGEKAIRYGVGVGAEGFVWSGRATVHTKQAGLVSAGRNAAEEA